tara:strand:- start:214 stop:597 length:384 start_codon:yes stop_codon:yes gene_type:complete
MNIFFKYTETRPNGHSSLMDDLAWCGHNERIDQLEECKQWMKKIVDDDHTNERLKKVSKKAIRYYDRLIKICNKYKNQQAITEDWSNKYLNKKYPKGLKGGVLGIKGKIYPTTNDYYKLLNKQQGEK